MRKLLVIGLLLGSLASGCQNSDLSQTPATGNASPNQTTNTLTPAIAQIPDSSTPGSTQGGKKVATLPNTTASGQQTCELSAYVIDKDPQGLNVRSGPGSSYKVIGNVPTTTAGVIVDITASQGGWVQLTKAESPQKTEFQGTGWVYSQLLGTSTRGYGTEGVTVYANADTQRSIGRISAETSVKLLGCNRSWAFVEYKGLKGWIAPDAQCPNPLTTCP